MIVRENLEVNLAPIIDSHGIAMAIYSSLASGILSGKYNEGMPEEETRLKDPFYKNFFIKYELEKRIDSLKQIADLAKSLNCTMVQLAYAWAIANKDVSICLIGATSVKQLNDSFECLTVIKKLNYEVLEKIEKILNNKPKAEINTRTFKPFPHRRQNF